VQKTETLFTPAYSGEMFRPYRKVLNIHNGLRLYEILKNDFAFRAQHIKGDIHCTILTKVGHKYGTVSLKHGYTLRMDTEEQITGKRNISRKTYTDPLCITLLVQLD